MIEEGTRAPSFCLKDAGEREVCLDDFLRKWVVLYFYPKDNTSGCTLEALEFTALENEFARLNAAVVGISPDSCASHTRFIDKHSLSVILLSDPDKTVIEPYGVWRMKKMYGKESMGVVRSTILVDPKGVTARTWTNVKAAGHAEKVLNELEKLSRA
ncbi:MAG: peroxiredoxin [Synergistota bacterium]|nr:peroxiredoxin [Synergistota bacterium]